MEPKGLKLLGQKCITCGVILTKDNCYWKSNAKSLTRRCIEHTLERNRARWAGVGGRGRNPEAFEKRMGDKARRDLLRSKPEPGKRLCTKCETYHDHADFLTSDTDQTWCRTCRSNYSTLRAMRLKKRAIIYLGGKCKRCSGIFHLGCYDFHHRDPVGKDLI